MVADAGSNFSQEGAVCHTIEHFLIGEPTTFDSAEYDIHLLSGSELGKIERICVSKRSDCSDNDALRFWMQKRKNPASDLPAGQVL